jgi:phenylacetate-coenzyme A ligase PaaK-like adenylate-forming protein
MVQSLRGELPLNVKLIDHGPKISLHVISNDFFNQMGPDEYSAIALDICQLDQSACANSQNIYLEQGIDLSHFFKALETAMKGYPVKLHDLNIHEHSDREGNFHQAIYEEFSTGIPAIKGENFLIQFDSSPYPSPTGLNRHVKIKTFNDISYLSDKLNEFSFYLQTCGLGVTDNQREEYAFSLGTVGVNRFTSIGDMLNGLIGSPHDGSFNLMDLVEVLCDESQEKITTFALNMTKALGFYSGKNIRCFEDIPLISGHELSEYNIASSELFMNPERGPGKIFSSGGTTGKPKYCFYENGEFDIVAKTLADSYLANGISGMGDSAFNIANLFVAGNMWSSFSIIQYALDKLNVNQFPMGGLINPEDFKELVKKFNIDVLFGLPSLLTDFARQTKGLQIKTVFYAGESFSKAARKVLQDNWGCQQIISAGYASVDVGPIGYQDETCVGDEHYLFEDLVHMEVIDDEAVVTSKVRKAMPIIRYRTGDRVQFLENGLDNRIKFKLLGRVDGQINIWSTRFYDTDIAKVLRKSLGNIDYQIQLKSSEVCDSLTIITKDLLTCDQCANIQKEIFIYCQDINQTHQFSFVKDKIHFESGNFLTNSKTGKFKIIFDLRK